MSPVRGAADHETPSTSDLAGAGDDDLLTLLHEHLSGPSPGDIDDLLRQHPERRERLEALYADYRLASRLMRGDGAALAPGRCERELGAVIAGRFTPVGVLGRGGMSIVMAAWDSRMRRKVALKCLRTREPTTAADLAGERRRRARLVNEAQVLAQLDHPGIVPVYDIVEEAGTDEVFVAMLRVRGVDLRQIYAWTWAHENGWNLARAVSVLQRVCEAVAYAHGKGVLHRDLKPANVMVGAFGQAYVMDWGLARSGMKAAPTAGTPWPLADEQSSSASRVVTDRDDDGGSSATYTRQGDVLGTPSYMAPEQASGDLDAADARADVYGVGAMLYELLAGHAPYARPGEQITSAQLLGEVRAGPPAPLVAEARAAPGELVAIAEKAMARAPGARYANMRALADDLRAFLEGRVVLAHRRGALVELSKWVRRNRGAAAAIAATVLLILVTLGMERTRSSELTALNRDLRARDYRNRVALAAGALQGGDPGEARSLLDGAAPELRGWEWRHLWAELDTSSQTFAGHAPRVIGLSIAPDGDRLVCGDDSGKVTSWDLQSGRRLAVSKPLRGPVYGLTFTPDGQEILASTAAPSIESLRGPALEIEQPCRFTDVAAVHGNLRAHDAIVSRDGALVFTASQRNCVGVWDRASGRLVRRLEGHRDWVNFLALSRAGDRLASASGDGTARIWGVPGGELLGVVGRPRDSRVDGVAFTPDGRHLITGSWRGRVDLWNIETGELEREIATLPSAVYRAAWSPDDTVVAVAAGPFIYLFSTDDWRLIDRLAGFERTVNNITFTPTGDVLAGSDQAGVVKTWRESELSGRRAWHAKEGGVREVSFDVASGAFVVGRMWGQIELWDPAAGALVRQFRLHYSLIETDVAPDGGWLATTNPQGVVQIHDLANGERLARYQVPGASIRDAAVHRGLNRVFLGHADATVQAHMLGSMRVEWRSPRVVTGGLEDMQISADGSVLVLATSTGGLAVVDVRTGAARGWEGNMRGVSRASPAADGRRVLVRRLEGNVALIDTDTGRELWRVPVVAGSGDCLLSPDGSRAFVGSASGVLVLDAANGQRIATLSRDRFGIVRMGTSRSGETLLTSSIDDAIRFWHAAAPPPR